MLAVSYVPGIMELFKDGRPISDCPGTCPGVDCSQCVIKCYACRAYKQYPTCTVNRVENTMQLREDPEKHFDDLKAEIIRRKVTTVRYTESGEIESFEQFYRLVKLADEMPGVYFYLYTKNYKVLREFFEIRELPENMTVLVSIWESAGVNEYQEFKDHAGIKAFVVNNPDIKVQAMCPAYRKDPATGKVKRVKSDKVKCGNCGLCTGKCKDIKVIGCWEH